MILNLFNNQEFITYFELFLIIIFFIFSFKHLIRFIISFLLKIKILNTFPYNIIISNGKSILHTATDGKINYLRLINNIHRNFPFSEIKILKKGHKIFICEVNGYKIPFFKRYYEIFICKILSVFSDNSIFDIVTDKSGKILFTSDKVLNHFSGQKINTIPELKAETFYKNKLFFSEDKKLLLIPFEITSLSKDLILWLTIKKDFLNSFANSLDIPVKVKFHDFEIVNHLSDEKRIKYLEEQTKHIIIDKIEWKSYNFEEFNWEIGNIKEYDIFSYYKYFFINFLNNINEFLKNWTENDFNMLKNKQEKIVKDLKGIIENYNKVKIKTDDIYEFLNYLYIPPELKEIILLTDRIIYKIETFKYLKENSIKIEFLKYSITIFLKTMELNLFSNNLLSLFQEIFTEIIEKNNIYEKEDINITEIFYKIDEDSFINEINEIMVSKEYKIVRNLLNLLNNIFLANVVLIKINSEKGKLIITFSTLSPQNLVELLKIYQDFFKNHTKLNIEFKDGQLIFFI